MTKRQAQAKVKELWGEKGHLHKFVSKNLGRDVYRVGYIDSTIFPMFFIEGQGDSWEEALESVKRDSKDTSDQKVTCYLCGKPTPAKTAHIHQTDPSGPTGWIGDECCWDERLRGSE